MFCPTCGTQLTGDARFCPTCGSPVEDEGPGAASPSPADPVAPAPAFAPARPAAPTAYRPAAPTRQEKPRKKALIAVAAVVALALVAGGAFAAYKIFVANNANDDQEQTEQVDDQDNGNRAELDQAGYQLYYDKCREYLEKYGEPGYETILASRYSDGFIFAKLLDLDGDGIDELVLGRREGGLAEIRTSLDVWTFDSESKTINLVTTNDDQPQLITDDGCTYINFIEANRSIYVEERPGSHYEALPVDNYTPEFKTLKDGSFAADDSFQRESDHYTIDGKECPVSETTYYLGPEEGNFASRDHAVSPKDTLATVHQTIDQLKQLSGNTDPEEQETAQQPQQESEQPATSSNKMPTYTFETKQVAVSVPVDPYRDPGNRQGIIWSYDQIVSSENSPAIEKINKTIRTAVEQSANLTNQLADTREGLEEHKKELGVTCITFRSISITFINDAYVCFLDHGNMTQWYDRNCAYSQGLCFSLSTGEAVSPCVVAGVQESQLIAETQSAMTTYLETSEHSIETSQIIDNLPKKVSFVDYFSNLCPVGSVPSTTHYVVTKYGVVYLTYFYGMGIDNPGIRQVVVHPFPGGNSTAGEEIKDDLTIPSKQLIN